MHLFMLCVPSQECVYMCVCVWTCVPWQELVLFLYCVGPKERVHVVLSLNLISVSGLGVFEFFSPQPKSSSLPGLRG